MWQWVAIGAVVLYVLSRNGPIGPSGTLSGDTMLGGEINDPGGNPMYLGGPRKLASSNVTAAKPGGSPTVSNPNVAGPVIAPALDASIPAFVDPITANLNNDARTQVYSPGANLTGDTRTQIVDAPVVQTPTNAGVNNTGADVRIMLVPDLVGYL